MQVDLGQVILNFDTTLMIRHKAGRLAPRQEKVYGIKPVHPYLPPLPIPLCSLQCFVFEAVDGHALYCFVSIGLASMTWCDLPG
jgi:hypothetical protein